MKSAAELVEMTLKYMKPPPQLTVLEWAEKNFMLPSTSAEPGRFRVNRIPYAAEILKAFTEGAVRKIAVKSAAQVGKSTILLAVAGRYAQLEPCTMMILQPTLEMAQDFSKDRLQRMIDDSAELKPLFFDSGKSRNRNQTILSKFFVGGRIVLQGANSPAGLASRPIRILLADEVDRFPSTAGEEGDPLSLAEKRQTTFFNRKTGIFSTPTVENASRIDVEYKLGTQEEWQHQCPNCGEFHFLDYRQMKVEASEERIDDYNKTVIVNSVKWQCPDCGTEHSESAMKNAAQKYMAQNLDALKNGVRSFWINGFSSTFLSWKTIMQEYLEAKGDALREAVVFNTRFGLSYKMTGEFENEDEFLERREEILSEVPDEVQLLTAGCDVQSNRLEITVIGWSAGETAYAIAHTIIRGSPNEIGTYLALDNLLAREWHYASGEKIKIARTFIDSGFATRAVYEYCAARSELGVFPIKGNGGVGIPLLHKYTYPKAHNVILTILGVNDGKSQIFSRLAIQNAETAGYIHFYKDTANLRRGFDRNYFQQLISERRVMRKSGGLVNLVWEKVDEKGRNEALDCLIYSYAAMKSCIGNLEPEQFWNNLRERAGSKAVKKSANKISSTAIEFVVG